MKHSPAESTVLSAYACDLQSAPALAECGAKAFNLNRMLHCDLPVPAGIVVTNRAFQSFLDQNKLHSFISEQMLNVDVQVAGSCQRASAAIQHAIMNGVIPLVVVEAVSEQLVALPSDGKLIVRSSAVGEDSAHSAFAGQLDSVLHVDHNLDAVRQALQVCWASYWSPRVLFYQHSRGVALNGMGVVIQAQVAAVMSGVLFTQLPLACRVEVGEQSNDSMLVEFCEGLGDQLVAGRVNPGRVLLSRDNATWRLQSWSADTLESDRLSGLCRQHMPRLARYGLDLESAFGGPQDVEWTISADGQLFLVQSRPITVAPQASPASVGPQKSQLAADDADNIVWSNANVNENFPDPICPLLYSIASLGYYHYFRNLGDAFGISERRIAAMEPLLQNLVGVHAGRLYYNLSHIHSVLRMAPFGELLAESFNLFVGSTSTKRVNHRLSWTGMARGRLWQTCELIRVLCKSTWSLLFLERRVRRFERTADAFAAQTQPASLANRSLGELLTDLRGFLAIRRAWTDASLADASAMLSYGFLKRFLSREFPSQDHTALHNSLLKGLRDVVSGTPLTELWKLSRTIRSEPALQALFVPTPGDAAPGARRSSADIFEQIRSRSQFAAFRTELDRFLECWGFRCSGELMLTVPSFQERPAAIIDILRSYSELEGESPLERLDGQNSERLATTRRIMEELDRRWLFRFLPWPRKGFLARRLLAWTQRSILYRERARLKQALLYSRCRRIVLAIGSNLAANQTVGQSEDVFYLNVAELESLLEGSSMFPAQVPQLVALRQTAHEEFCRQRPPDTFTLPYGRYWSPAERWNSPRTDTALSGDILHGTGLCGGVVTAPAAVLHDVTEQDRLTAGDLLVTRQTDPGWAPVFMLIRGLVMERGGMLSHGAILAREYGLPTVVGIDQATHRIRPGQTITVNGDRGHVELL